MNQENKNFENIQPQPNDDDLYIIDKGFNISTESSITETKKSKNQPKTTLKNIIWICSIVIVSFGLAFGIIYAGADFMGLGFGRGENCGMNIEMGTPASKIAEQLKECGAVKIPALFRLYSKLNGYDSQFKYGFYSFNNEAGYEAIAQMLINEGAKAESITVTIPEGTGINDYVKNVNGQKVTVLGIGSILENAGVCSRSDFLKALRETDLNTKLLRNSNKGKVYYELEGYLFPETYEFFAYDSEECARLVVDKMIAESDKRITDKMHKRAQELGYSMNEILTMASIIQMESGKASDEMANVAAIFYNRLNSKNFATLGSSPTCYYGDSFKNDDGRYNTYTAQGLPPGPLCSPGIDAIKAALYPSENMDGYYYFVTDSKGNFYYHKTLSEQNKTIKKLQQGNNWVYEYFD